MPEQEKRALDGMLLECPKIAGAWAVFERLVLDPCGAGPAQRSESRKVFYAGADWALKRVIHGSADEEAGMRLLSAMLKECDDFRAEIQRESDREQGSR
jgi:hypothetical protein